MRQTVAVKSYIEALDKAGILVESCIPDSILDEKVDCLTYDTRKIYGKSIFIVKGAHFKQEYLESAIESGALLYVADKKYDIDAPYVIVSDIRYSLVVLGMLHYDHITDKLTTIGITGTKGKTTTNYFVKEIIDQWQASLDKKPCAILSSIDIYDGASTQESLLTTPEVLEIYEHFQNAYDNGLQYMSMEASSQALKYGRVRDMKYEVGCFTNIGEDHISPIEHPNFEDYFASKLKIFDASNKACVNMNADHADEILSYAKSKCDTVITFGYDENCTVYCDAYTKKADGIYFNVVSPKYNGEFAIGMPGLFNVENALAAISICMALDVPEQFVRSGLWEARVSGRMQQFESKDKRVVVIVDYAHNKMSMEALCSSAKQEYVGKKLITIFGCSGSKALQRRIDKPAASSKYSDFVYVTEDDTGEEAFEDIVAEIVKHIVCPYEIIEDRKECIRHAILDEKDSRVICITGKGTETTLKRGTEYYPYESDAVLAQRFVEEYDKLAEERYKKI